MTTGNTSYQSGAVVIAPLQRSQGAGDVAPLARWHLLVGC